MNIYKARVFYGIFLTLALALGYIFSYVLIQDNYELKRSAATTNEYHRVMVCKAQSYDKFAGPCKRVLV